MIRRKIMDKVFLLIMGTLVLGIFAMSGCSKKEAESQRKIHLRFAAYGNPRFNSFRTRMGKEFEKLHPGVAVKYDGVVGDYRTKILTQLAGGVAPDVFTLSEWEIAEYASKGVLMDLTAFLKDEEDESIKDIYPRLLNLCRYDGRFYGLPRNVGSIGLFYNKELFDEEGVDYPDGSWDWDKLLEAARKLTKRDERGYVKQFGLAFPLSWPMLIKEMGGEFWNKEKTECLIDSQETIEAIQFVKDLILKYNVCPSPKQKEMQTDYIMFSSKRAAMFIGGNWYRTHFKEIKDLDWHVAPMPKGKMKSTWLLCGIWVVSSQSKHPELAYELVKFLCSPEAVKFLMEEGDCIPMHRTEKEIEYFLNLAPPPDREAQAFINAIEQGYTLREKFLYPGLSFDEMMEVMYRQLDKFMLDRQTAKETLTKIKQEWLKMTEIAKTHGKH